VTFTDTRIADIAAEILNDEMLHVKFLRTALGAMGRGRACDKPQTPWESVFASQAEFPHVVSRVRRHRCKRLRGRGNATQRE